MNYVSDFNLSDGPRLGHYWSLKAESTPSPCSVVANTVFC
jgi:hypothetical protein